MKKIILFISLLLLTCSAYSSAVAVRYLNQYRPQQNDYYGSLWGVIRSGFELNHHASYSRVNYYLKYYESHQELLFLLAKRAKPYLYTIVGQLKQKHLPQELALLPFLESGFRPTVQSSASAVGLWQLIRSTALRFNVTINWWFDGRRDTKQSTRAALEYLDYLHVHFSNWALAIAAYNSGEGNVQKAIRRNKYNGRATDFWSLPLPAQTNEYVPKLMALSIIVANPERYGVTLPPIPNEPLLTAVRLPCQLSLKLAAQLAGISEASVRTFNPAYLQYATLPFKTNYLYIPRDRIGLFAKNLAAYPKEKLYTWHSIMVKRGETLHLIAKKTNNSMTELRSYNDLQNNYIYAGQYLLYAKKPVIYQLYLVERGDTLSTIAKRFNTTVASIVKLNHIKTNGILRVGQKLIV